jgi:hypothetical protein
MKTATRCLLAFCVMSAIALASPLPCEFGTAATIENTSCSVGNVLFTLGSASTFDYSGLLNLSLSDFTMTPNASNPLSPGFTLSGSVTEASTGIEGGGGLQWSVQLQTLSGQPLIAGVTATVRGSAPDGFSLVAIFEQCDAASSSNCAFAQPGFNPEGCLGPSCTVSSNFSTPVSATDTAPTDDLMYEAISPFSASGTPATVTSASFGIRELTSVPEPSTKTPLGSVLLTVITARMLQKRRIPVN